MNSLERATAIGVQGFLHSSELEQLIDLACRRDVLELGSFMGLSAWGMAQTAHSLFCVDTFSANSAGQQQMGHLTTLDAFLQAVSRYRNVKHFVGTSEEAHRQANPIGQNTEGGPFVPHGQFDMIFVDAMHDYENVKADIERWWPRVKSGGIMAFHDYGHGDFPGVKLAVDERFGELPNRVVTLGWITK